MIAEPDFLCSIEMNTVNPFYAIQSKRARDLQPLRSANLAVGVLTLILLVAVPVSGAPALKVGSNSSYTLSFSITFSPPFCETSPSSDPQMIVYCPMIAIVPPTFNINGTLDWTATSLTNTTAVLNVVREVTTSSWDSLAATDFRSLHSFNESIDLATRIANIVPFVTPEMFEALQIAQNSMGMTLSQGTGWTTPANIITSDMMERQPIHTMWWANGPLHLNQTIPVLFFPANVTGPTTVDLGSLGTRAAWTLTYNFTLPTPLPQQETSGTSIPTGDGIQAAFAFNYDQQSDLLLSASADIRVGYLEGSPYQPSQCNASTTTAATWWCPSASSSTTIIPFGFSIQASLTLANTNLNLDQRLGPTNPSDGSTTASGSGTRSGSGSGTESASGTGTGGYGQGSDSGSSSGSGSGSGTGSNPGNIPQSTTPKPSWAMVPWIYWIIGIVAIAIIATSLWAARRRTSRTSTAVQPPI